MSEPANRPPNPLDDNFVTFWDIVWRQFFRNRVAVTALYSLLVVIVLAIAAPLIALNIPYVLWTSEKTEWPLFIKLFDGHVFSSSVDIFFNVLLLLLPVWMLSARVIHHLGLSGATPNRKRASLWLVPTALLLAFYVRLAFEPNSRYLHVLGFALFGTALMTYSSHRARSLSARDRRHQRNRVRIALAGLVASLVALMVFAWGFTSPSVTYRAEIAQLEASDTGGALSPPIFFHPDNRNDDQSYVLQNRLNPPSMSARTLLGCDNNGRDVFTRILYGARISLTIGIVAVSIYVAIGVFLGSLAGYFGGKTDMLIIYILQVMMCIPGLFLILAIMAFFDERSIFLIMGVIGLTSWTGVTRLVRGEFFRQRSIEYVTAAKCLGIPERRIIFGHILKNSVGPVLVSAAFGIAGAVLTESFLAFIGLGDTNAPSWGQILQEGRTHRKAWLLYSPGIAIFYLVTVLNLVGEGIRDALDPKLRT